MQLTMEPIRPALFPTRTDTLTIGSALYLRLPDKVAQVRVATRREGLPGEPVPRRPPSRSPDQLQRIKPLLLLIEANLHRPLKGEELAKKVNISRFHFLHLFKEAMGESLGRYCTRLRLEKARKLLESESMSLERIAMEVGMPSGKALSYHFKKRFRVAPVRFRRDAASRVFMSP